VAGDRSLAGLGSTAATYPLNTLVGPALLLAGRLLLMLAGLYSKGRGT